MNTQTVKKQTHISLIRDLNLNQMQDVCLLLNWTELSYCQHQFDEYQLFLSRVFYGFPDEMLKQVMYSKIMSGFWNNEWSFRNEIDFIPFAHELLSDALHTDLDGMQITQFGLSSGDEFITEQYLYVHNHRVLMNDDQFMINFNDTLSSIRKEAAKC